MPLASNQRHPLMCITQGGIALGPAEQAARACGAGARWVQLRLKETPWDQWMATAREVTEACHAHGAVCIINDSVEIALEAGADGVHLGRTDMDWREARRRLGPGRILGGTVNYDSDADKARKAGCLDYVGVGPLRFTRTKRELAPLRGFDGIRRLLDLIGAIPAWGIGGVEVADLPLLRSTGTTGAAVCSALFRDGTVESNVKAFLAAWPGPGGAVGA